VRRIFCTTVRFDGLLGGVLTANFFEWTLAITFE